MRDGSDEVLLALVLVFAPLSLLALGGGTAVIADIAEQSIAVHNWTSEREFSDLFALSRAAPGPGSMLAALIGWKVAGIAGAAVATAAFYLPPALLVSGARAAGRAAAPKEDGASEGGPQWCRCRGSARGRTVIGATHTSSSEATTIWEELPRLVREAVALGAEFRITGDRVAIDGDLPPDIRSRLSDNADALYIYFRAARTDVRAVDFLAGLGVTPVLVTDRDDAEVAMAALTGVYRLGLDIETAVPGRRPPPVRVNLDGSVSARQPAADDRAGLDPHQADIALVQLYGGGGKCYLFRGEALRHLVDSSWLRKQRLVAHSAGFELSFLRARSTPPDGVRGKLPIECTLQAFGLMHGTQRRSLAEAAKVVLGLEPPKELQTSDWSADRLSAGQLAYATSDAVLTYRLWKALSPALVKNGRQAAYALQRSAISAVADMRHRGLGFDPAEHECQSGAWARELAGARREYLDLTGEPPPSKPAEVREWLGRVVDLRYENWPRTATGELSVERKYLKRLILSDVPTTKPVLAILAKMKLLSTFGPRLRDHINPVTGRIHCTYNNAASKAGRFTASGPNLQQLPSARAPEFKACIVAAPGNLLIAGDWSQVELRAAAWVSKDPALCRVYAEGRDLHRETAAAIASVSPEEVTAAQRQAAKAVNFGSIYGIGARSLAENAFDSYGIDMTMGEAQQALDRFFLRYATLKRWMVDHNQRCQRQGYVEIGCGRVVEAKWEPSGRLSFPQCCNLPIQGAAADAMLRALTLVFRQLRGLSGGLVASVHDELVIEVAENDAERASRILAETMTEAFELTFPGAPTAGVVTIASGRTWKAARGG